MMKFDRFLRGTRCSLTVAVQSPTGRLSVYGPEVQVLTRTGRIVDEHHYLVKADYSDIEQRILSYYAGRAVAGTGQEASVRR